MQTFLESAKKSFIANTIGVEAFGECWWNSSVTDKEQFRICDGYHNGIADCDDTETDHCILLLLMAAITGEI